MLCKPVFIHTNFNACPTYFWFQFCSRLFRVWKIIQQPVKRKIKKNPSPIQTKQLSMLSFILCIKYFSVSEHIFHYAHTANNNYNENVQVYNNK